MQNYKKLNEIEVSRYYSAKESSRQAGKLSLLHFLQDVKQGQYVRAVLAVRNEPDPKKQATLKNGTIAAVTPSGQWQGPRTMAAEHRQYAIVCIDIDGKDQTRPITEIAEALAAQVATTSTGAGPVVFAYHRSLRGDGFAVYYSYEPAEGQAVDEQAHHQAFEYLRAFYEAQGIVIDKGCKDPTRIRFASYDPEAFICGEPSGVSIAYTDHPEKVEAQKPTAAPPQRTAAPAPEAQAPAAADGRAMPATPQPQAPAAGVSFEYYQAQRDAAFITAHCERHGYDLCNEYAARKGLNAYDAWLKMAQALSSFGAFGEQLFIAHSNIRAAHSPAQHYRPEELPKKWQEIQKTTRSVKYTSFFHMAKECGLPLRDTHHQRAFSCATSWMPKVGQAGGAKNKEAVIRGIVEIVKQEGATPEQQQQAVEIAEHIAQRPDLWNQEKVTLPEVQQFFARLDLRYNVVSQRYEFKGEELDDRIFSMLLMRAKLKLGGRMGKEITRELAQTIIQDKSQTPEHNPFESYLDSIKGKHSGGGYVDAMLNCISFVDEQKAEFCRELVRRWMLGVVASMRGVHSVLCLVFTGGQGIGKTLFFRELLPTPLQKYYAQDKLKEGKDSMMLLSRKLIICDDEWGGKSKKDVEAMKEILSMETITARKPYGVFEEDMKRRAVLCGTTNRADLLSDDSGNRRILPVGVASIDIEGMRQIDRDGLFAELLQEYEANPEGWYLNFEIVQQLKELTEGHYDAPSREADILKVIFHSAEATKQDLRLEEAHPDTFGGALVEVSTAWICKQIEMIAGGKFTANATKVGTYMKGRGYDKRKAKADSLQYMTRKGTRAWVVSFTREFEEQQAQLQPQAHTYKPPF